MQASYQIVLLEFDSQRFAAEAECFVVVSEYFALATVYFAHGSWKWLCSDQLHSFVIYKIYKL